MATMLNLIDSFEGRTNTKSASQSQPEHKDLVDFFSWLDDKADKEDIAIAKSSTNVTFAKR